jgi:hypothetical protein
MNIFVGRWHHFHWSVPASDPARKLSVGEWIIGKSMSGNRPHL